MYAANRRSIQELEPTLVHQKPTIAEDEFISFNNMRDDFEAQYEAKETTTQEAQRIEKLRSLSQKQPPNPDDHLGKKNALERPPPESPQTKRRLAEISEDDEKRVKRRKENISRNHRFNRLDWIEKVLQKRTRPPWVQGHSYSRDLLKRLHQEIIDFTDYISPTDEENSIRQWTVERLRGVVDRIWKRKACVEVFGSFDTMLYLPTSDIDVVVQMGSINTKPRYLLSALADKLRSTKVGINIKTISGAKVPIVKYTDRISKINVDVCFNNSSGGESAAVVREFLTTMPALRPLVLILKHYLLMRNQNEVFTGGLGSYACTSLVISFLQMHSKLRQKEILPEENLGVLLIDMFKLYGFDFNYSEVGISLRNGGKYFRKKEKNWFVHFRPFLLSIEDASNPDNDISKGSYEIRKIKKAFRHTFFSLTSTMAAHETLMYDSRGELYRDYQHFQPVSLLESLLLVPPSTLKFRQMLLDLSMKLISEKELNILETTQDKAKTDSEDNRDDFARDSDYHYVEDSSDF